MSQITKRLLSFRKLIRSAKRPLSARQRGGNAIAGAVHRALIVGPFSFPDWKATFGDTGAMRVAAAWLDETGIAYDIACDPSNGLSGVKLEELSPSAYTILVYVCGPWDKGRRDHFLRHFGDVTTIGMNVSVLEPDAHGFDYVIPRDMGDIHNPDFVFAERSTSPKSPLVGIILVHPQGEYGDRQRHAAVERTVREYLEHSDVVPITLDTLHVNNRTSVRSGDQLLALLRRLDIVISSRLHGVVFALKAGVPVVAIDPIAGKAKVSSQAKALGWPLVLDGDTMTVDDLKRAVEQCLSGSLMSEIAAVQNRANRRLDEQRAEFTAAMRHFREYGRFGSVD